MIPQSYPLYVHIQWNEGEELFLPIVGWDFDDERSPTKRVAWIASSGGMGLQSVLVLIGEGWTFLGYTNYMA
jgi:hypothetical protein